jgi:DHA1 family bicyclomycin/chloramphenicol resistance-like MFS transporter
MTPPSVTNRLPLLLGFLIAVGPISTDMYLTAFPAIARDFHNAAAPQISLAAYFLGLAIGQMTQGALSDRLGRRGPLMAGLVIYTFASLGCALCWSVESFAAFRLLAALGCSAGMVIPRAMVRDLADGHAAARMFSKLMLVMGVAPIVAPMLGSAVVIFADWRMIFGLCAVYGVLAVVLAYLYLPDTLPLARRTRIGLGAVLVRYGVILRERAFITHALTGGFTSGALFAYLAATPQVFIGIYGWTTAGCAGAFGANALGYIAINQFTPALVSRFGVGAVISFGVSMLAACCLGLTLLAWHPLGPFAVAGVLVVSSLGFGLVTPCVMVGALSRHQAHAGSATAVLGTIQFIFGAIAGLAVGVLADGTATPMAGTMLLCALAAMLAASQRPKLVFALAET